MTRAVTPSPDPGGHVPVAAEIDLRVGADAYRNSGPTDCKLTRDATLDGKPASHFDIAHDASAWKLTLQVWQPRDGAAEAMTLELSSPGRRYLVDTTRGDRSTATRGSGHALFERVRLGGTFTIDAVASDGTVIAGTVKCSRFTGIVAEAR